VTGPSVNPEYLRRNLLVASAAGACANAQSAGARLRRMKRPPKWLVEVLDGIRDRTRPLAGPLADYRNQVPREVNRGK
jgi:hypothetical protein